MEANISQQILTGYWPETVASRKESLDPAALLFSLTKTGRQRGKSKEGQETLTHGSSTGSGLHGHQPRTVPLAWAAIPLSHPVDSAALLGDFGKRHSPDPGCANTSGCARTNLQGSLLPLTILHRSMEYRTPDEHAPPPSHSPHSTQPNGMQLHSQPARNPCLYLAQPAKSQPNSTFSLHRDGCEPFVIPQAGKETTRTKEELP